MKNKRSELADLLADTLNNKFKATNYKTAYFLEDDPDAPTNVNEWVPTGSSILDIKISNKPNGGFPLGRISEVIGLEACVTEDTLIDVIIESIYKTIPIKEVQELLKVGKNIKVKTKNNEYVDILNYIDKGYLDTYLVELDNGNSIKVSKDHLFFTDSGWIKTTDLLYIKHNILCDDNEYHKVKYVVAIGKHKIVDITVDHPEECYFGNGLLNHNSGKSLLAAHALANTQKKGGIAVYIETESSVSKEFLRAIGVDLKNLVYVPLDTIEDVFEAIESIIEKIRKTSKDVLVTIVVDSVAATTTKLEMSSDYDKAGYNTGKSIIISQALRKITNTIARERVCLIFTNQLRKNMTSMPGQDPYTTSGGMALAFHSSVRIRLRNMGKLKAKIGGIDEIVGMKTRVVITKNRVGPPWKELVYDIYFNSGIDDCGGWLTVMKERKLVKQAGAWYEYTDKDTGEVIKFQSKDFESIVLSDKTRKETIYNDICKSLISKYKANEDGGIDDIKVDENIYKDDIDDTPTDSEDDEKPSAKIKPNSDAE